MHGKMISPQDDKDIIQNCTSNETSYFIDSQ